MKEINSEEKLGKNNPSSFLNEFIIPKRLINANSLIQSLKNKKYSWENDGIKVKI